MKKKYIVIVIMIVTFLVYKNFNTGGELEEIKEAFTKIDESSSKTEKIDQTISRLKNYLVKHDLGSKDIKKISPNIKIFEDDDIRIIQYRQPSNIYGNSTRGSWKLLQYKPYELTVSFQNNMPVNLIDYRAITSKNDIILFTYNENHEINHRKIQIFSHIIKRSGLEERELILKEEQQSDKWAYNAELGLVWNKNNFGIFIDSISKNGEKVIVGSVNDKGEKDLLELRLNVGLCNN